MEEIWKIVDGFENYQVSNLGNVISKRRNGEWLPLSQYKTPIGYMYVNISKNNKVTHTGVHSLVAKAFVDGWFEGAEVNHKDLNKENNCADNLEWITRSENQKHQYYLYHPDYKVPICEKCGKPISDKRSKLCWECTLEKRKSSWPTKEFLSELLKTKNFTEIGRELNCTDNAVRKICRYYGLPDSLNAVKQFRKDNNCYVPTKKEQKLSYEERYTLYEVDGIAKTATTWSKFLGLESKHIKRYANKHTYEETIEYIRYWINKNNINLETQGQSLSHK